MIVLILQQMERVNDGDYNPIVIDKEGFIVNGHHRYDALRLLDHKQAKVHMIDGTLKEIMELMKR